jgi:hypothetical protein
LQQADDAFDCRLLTAKPRRLQFHKQHWSPAPEGPLATQQHPLFKSLDIDLDGVDACDSLLVAKVIPTWSDKATSWTCTTSCKPLIATWSRKSARVGGFGSKA